MLKGRRILLIVAGGIAAFKVPELIRLLVAEGALVRALLTDGGARFVTPLTLQALTGEKVYGDLFSLTDESEMGHIQLSRDADLLVVVPASADILARMRAGIADDLATTVLLATDKPVLVAPSMNVRMWTHPATQDNLTTLTRRGIRVVGPQEGDMACGEYGPGRMAEPPEIVAAIEAVSANPEEANRGASPEGSLKGIGPASPASGRLWGKRALVTCGPTLEAIDPLRYIANRSSGKQGCAIAVALAAMGAETVLVTGPISLPDPVGLRTVRVESALEMDDACQAALPADIAVCAAAVADWRVENAAAEKLKKTGDGAVPTLRLIENPDILARLSQAGAGRPALVIGFAAETGDLVARATAKRERKGCDWIIANDVSLASGTFGGDENRVHLIRPPTGTDAADPDAAGPDAAGPDGAGTSATGPATTCENWPRMSKDAVAARLASCIAEHFEAAGAAE